MRFRYLFAMLTAVILTLLVVFSQEESPTDTMAAEPTVFVADSPFAVGELLAPDESVYRETWEIAYGNFPHMDGSDALSALAERFAQLQLNPNGAISTELTDFMGKPYAMDSFVLDREFSNSIFYDSEQRVFFASTPSNLLLLVNFTPANQQLLESGGKSVCADVFARTALVLYTSQDTPIDSLTIPQLKGILSGELTELSALCDMDAAIHLYYQFGNLQEDALDVLHNRVLGDASLREPVMEEQTIPSGIPGGDDYAIPVTSDYSNAIGNIGIGLYQDVVQMPDVQMLAIEGTPPNPETVRTGEYPLWLDCSAVYAQENAETAPGKAAAWLHTAQGKALLEQVGLVPTA